MFHHFPQDSPCIGGYRNPHLSDLHLGNPTEKISKPQSSAGFGFWSLRPAPARPGRPGISCTEVQGWGGQVGNSLSHHGFQYPNGLTWIHWGPVDIIDIMDTAELMPLTSQVREWAFEHPRPQGGKIVVGWNWKMDENGLYLKCESWLSTGTQDDQSVMCWNLEAREAAGKVGSKPAVSGSSCKGLDQLFW